MKNIKLLLESIPLLVDSSERCWELLLKIIFLSLRLRDVKRPFAPNFAKATLGKQDKLTP